jgi:hypothetical protein
MLLLREHSLKQAPAHAQDNFSNEWAYQPVMFSSGVVQSASRTKVKNIVDLGSW